MKNLRMVEELNDREYTDLIIRLTDDEEQAKKVCAEMNVDFEDVKLYDWYFAWQY